MFVYVCLFLCVWKCWMFECVNVFVYVFYMNVQGVNEMHVILCV